MNAWKPSLSKTIILYPYGAKHLGLFDDLKNNAQVYLRYSERRALRFPGFSFLRIGEGPQRGPIENERGDGRQRFCADARPSPVPFICITTSHMVRCSACICC